MDNSDAAMSGTFRGMRVLVIGKSLAQDSMEFHVLETLKAMGCEAVCLAPSGKPPGGIRWLQRAGQHAASLLFREPERRGEPRLSAQVADFSPELTLVIQGNQLSPKTVHALRRATRSPIVCWCQDAIASYGRQYLLGAEYDVVFVKDRFLHDQFSRHIASTQFHYLPEACNPQVHRPVEISAVDRKTFGCDLLMLGSLYYYRQELLRQLDEFDLHIYGNRPAWLMDRLASCHRGGELVMADKSRAVGAARIALNPLHCSEIDGLNCRAFELAGCGGFQIISHRPVLEQHFVPGLEVESFTSVDELKDKIRHYLAHPDKAVEIARSGQCRAFREHTYRHRIEEIFRVAGVGR